MSKLTDSLLRSYHNAVIIAGKSDKDEALMAAVESATAFMYASDERKADLFARLVDAGFHDMVGVGRRITTNTVLRQWRYDHIAGVSTPPAPKYSFKYPNPTFSVSTKQWFLDTYLGEKCARDVFEAEPTAEEVLSTRTAQEARLIKDAESNG